MTEWDKAQLTWIERSNANYWTINRTEPYIELITYVMLENQRLYNETFDIPNKNVFNNIKEIIPNLLAHKIVSVQPMLSPQASVYYSKLIKSGQLFDSNFVEKIEKENIIAIYRSTENKKNNQEIIDLIDDEILTDLFSNSGLIYQSENDTMKKVYNAISYAVIDLMECSKRNDNIWLVIHPNTFRKYELIFHTAFDKKHKIYKSKMISEYYIQLGWKGKLPYESSYIWCPYIMFGNNNDNIKYGKKLVHNGAINYAKVKINH